MAFKQFLAMRGKQTNKIQSLPIEKPLNIAPLKGKNFFFTYPKCDIPKQTALNKFVEFFKQDMDKIAINTELHQDGTPHLHVVFRTNQTNVWKAADIKKLDSILGVHGNYKVHKAFAQKLGYIMGENKDIVHYGFNEETPFDMANRRKKRDQSDNVVRKKGPMTVYADLEAGTHKTLIDFVRDPDYRHCILKITGDIDKAITTYNTYMINQIDPFLKWKGLPNPPINDPIFEKHNTSISNRRKIKELIREINKSLYHMLPGKTNKDKIRTAPIEICGPQEIGKTWLIDWLKQFITIFEVNDTEAFDDNLSKLRYQAMHLSDVGAGIKKSIGWIKKTLGKEANNYTAKGLSSTIAKLDLPIFLTTNEPLITIPEIQKLGERHIAAINRRVTTFNITEKIPPEFFQIYKNPEDLDEGFIVQSSTLNNQAIKDGKKKFKYMIQEDMIDYQISSGEFTGETGDSDDNDYYENSPHNEDAVSRFINNEGEQEEDEYAYQGEPTKEEKQKQEQLLKRLYLESLGNNNNNANSYEYEENSVQSQNESEEITPYQEYEEERASIFDKKRRWIDVIAQPFDEDKFYEKREFSKLKRKK